MTEPRPIEDKVRSLFQQRHQVAEKSDRWLIEETYGMTMKLYEKIYENGLAGQIAKNTSFRQWSIRAYVGIVSVVFGTGLYFLFEKIAR